MTSEDKPRPLRIRLESKLLRQKLVASAHKLKSLSNFKVIYVKPDLTPTERVKQRELRVILKKDSRIPGDYVENRKLYNS